MKNIQPCDKSSVMADVIYRHMKGHLKAAFADIPVARLIHENVATVIPDHPHPQPHAIYANKWADAVHGKVPSPPSASLAAQPLTHEDHLSHAHNILKGGKPEDTPRLVQHLASLTPTHLKSLKDTHGVEGHGSEQPALIHAITSHFNRRYVQQGPMPTHRVHELTRPYRDANLNQDDMATGKAEFSNLKHQYGPLLQHRLHEMAKDHLSDMQSLPQGATQDRLQHQKNLAKIHWMAQQAHAEGIHGDVEDPSLKNMDKNVSRIRLGEKLRGTPWIHMLAHSLAHHTGLKSESPAGHYTGEQLNQVLQDLRTGRYTGENLDKALKALHHDYGTITAEQLKQILPHVGKGIAGREGHLNQNDMISAHAHREGVKKHEFARARKQANFSQESFMSIAPGTCCIYKSPTVVSGSDDDGTMIGDNVQVKVISYDAKTNSYLIENSDGTRIRVKDDMLIPEGTTENNKDNGSVPTDKTTKSYFSAEMPAEEVSADARIFVEGIPHIECSVPVLFRTGDFPDKNFSMNKDELAAAHAAFEPNKLPIGLSHTPTVFDGHMGALTHLAIDETGEVASAKARIPEWLHNCVRKIGDGKFAISATWDRVTKKLLGADIVPKGRIEDAALQAAFGGPAPTANNTGTRRPDPKGNGDPQPDGQGPESGKTVMHGKDLCHHICGMADDSLDHVDTNKETFHPKYVKFLNSLRKLCVSMGGNSRRKHADDDAGGEEEAKFSATDAAEFQKTVDEQKATIATQIASLNEQKAAFAKAQEENAKLNAALFSAGLLMAKKISPAEKAHLETSYIVAATDDMNSPAKFGSGKTRIELLKETYEAKPIHPLMKDVTEFSLLDTSDKQNEQRKLQEEVKRDLSRTALGREAAKFNATQKVN
jgi:hypothetical protein